MFKAIKRFLNEKSQWNEFNSLDKKDRELVFYAETKNDWLFLGPIVKEIAKTYPHKIGYLTSDHNDPLLKESPDFLNVFCIGDGSVCTIAFKTIDAKMMVLTLLDLETFHLKRSVNNVHYTYVFHSLASTHVAFRELAHHHYDTVLTPGPQYSKEIREVEKVYNLKAKDVIETGYCRLDELLEKAKDVAQVDYSVEKKNIVIAPSWGNGSISNNCAEELIESLLGSGHNVIFRPHPMSYTSDPGLLEGIDKKFQGRENYTFESNLKSTSSYDTAHALITDWSGAAYEFSFSYQRPVLFINTPRKINNPQHEKISIEPVEIYGREKIGRAIEMNEVDKASDYINDLFSNIDTKKDEIVSFSKELITHHRSSAIESSKVILQKFNEL